jgi:hypothetical protein
VGTIQGTRQSGANFGPLIEARFHVTFLQCAQECAHSMVTISLPRIAEPIAAQGISGKAAVFSSRRHRQNASTRKIRRIRKCLRAVYLQGRRGGREAEGGGLLNRPGPDQPLVNCAESRGFRPKTSRSRFCPGVSRSAVCRHDSCTICCTSGTARSRISRHTLASPWAPERVGTVLASKRGGSGPGSLVCAQVPRFTGAVSPDASDM